ncbi:MAG: Ig-like domain-containing protein [bacterium]|nr:Ig-like domain-containing protein [bacterium]
MRTVPIILLFAVVFALPVLAYDEVDTSSATASAWSEYTPNYPASNALDDNYGTFWSNDRSVNPTTDGAGDWFQVEWPDDVDVCYIRTEGRSYQSGYYSIPHEVRLTFSDYSYIDFEFEDTTQDHYVQEYYFDADQKTTSVVDFGFLSYFHHVWEYVQYYEVNFYYELNPDSDPPYVADMEPTDGESYVPIDSDIVFHCVDDASNIDLDTIDFTAHDTTLSDGRAVSADASIGVVFGSTVTIDGDLDVDDTDPMDVICTFTPDDPLPYGDTITCTVAAGLADVIGNVMVDDFVWTFNTEDSPGLVYQSTWGAIKAEF